MMMQRREFITGLGGTVAWPLVARAQQGERLRRVGVLIGGGDDTEQRSLVEIFRRALQALGWTEGRNVEFHVRWAAFDADRATAHARELVGLSPEVIFALPTFSVVPLKKETDSIPIVFAGVADPIEQGVVSSLARPTGNITGFSNPDFSIVGKSLQMLKDVAPGVTRVAAIISRVNGAAPFYLRSFVGADKHRCRDSDAKRLGRLEVDEQLNFCRLLHWQVSGLLAVENPASINPGLTVRIEDAASVAQQPAGGGELAPFVDRRQRPTTGQRSKLFDPTVEQGIRADHKACHLQSRHRSKYRVEFRLTVRMQDVELYPERTSRCLQPFCDRLCERGISRINQHRKAGRVGDQLVQQFQALRRNLDVQRYHARHIAARSIEAGDQPEYLFGYYFREDGQERYEGAWALSRAASETPD
jgi:hypothetical protein